MEASSIDSMDHLSETWCSMAIQVFEPAITESSIMPRETNTKDIDEKPGTEDGETTSISPRKLDDIKSWTWLQQAFHPELDYDLRFKKWFSHKLNTKGISIKNWVKQTKQKRKEDERRRKAEVYAAISVAGLAAALAALAADNTIANQPKSLKQTAVASAAALVAAQCAHVAESAGAKHNQLAAAIVAAMAAPDASNIITLTAAAATSLKGVSALRGRPDQRERIKRSTPNITDEELNYDYGRGKVLLAKGDNLLVGTSDGKCRVRSVSIALNIDGEVILKIKKSNFLMVFPSAKESTVYTLDTKPFKEPMKKDVATYSIRMDTSKRRIELSINDYMQYRKWTMTINQMLTVSATFSKYGNPTLQK